MPNTQRIITKWARKFQPELRFGFSVSAPTKGANWSDFPDFWISNLHLDPIPDAIKDRCWVWSKVHLHKGSTAPLITFPVLATGEPISTRKQLNVYLWELKNQTLLPEGARLKSICEVRGCCNPEHWKRKQSSAEMAAQLAEARTQNGPGPEPVSHPHPDAGSGSGPHAIGSHDQSSVALQNQFPSAPGYEDFVFMLDELTPQPRSKDVVFKRFIESGFFTEGEIETHFNNLPSHIRERYP